MVQITLRFALKKKLEVKMATPKPAFPTLNIDQVAILVYFGRRATLKSD